MRNFEFKKLSKYLDNILNKYKMYDSILAYSKLHFLKNHPEVNKEYFYNLSLETVTANNYPNLKRNIFKSIFNFFKRFLNEQPNFYYKKKYKKTDVLFFSHIININQLNNKNDFYYGDIQKQLKLFGFDSKIIIRNETSFASKNLFQKLKRDKIILSDRTYFINELFYYLLSIFQFLNFNVYIKKFKLKDKKINFFSFKSFAYIAYNLKLNFQINLFIKKFRPKFIVITFEGHAWERLLIKNIKKTKTKIIAYQFSSITKNHHGIFRSLGEEYDPDCIFTTGKRISSIFKKKYKCKVRVVGSNKWIKNKTYINNNNNKCILILTEGHIADCIKLINFGIEISKLDEDLKLYLRIHPLIKNKHKINLDSYKNVEISNKSIEQDFYRSSYFIYTGTASAVQAAAYGLNPIYYGSKNNLNTNPLFEVLRDEFYVTDPKQFIKIIKKKNFKKNSRLRKYSREFFKRLKIKKNYFDI